MSNKCQGPTCLHFPAWGLFPTMDFFSYSFLDQTHTITCLLSWVNSPAPATYMLWYQDLSGATPPFSSLTQNTVITSSVALYFQTGLPVAYAQHLLKSYSEMWVTSYHHYSVPTSPRSTGSPPQSQCSAQVCPANHHSFSDHSSHPSYFSIVVTRDHDQAHFTTHLI